MMFTAVCVIPCYVDVHKEKLIFSTAFCRISSVSSVVQQTGLRCDAIKIFIL